MVINKKKVNIFFIIFFAVWDSTIVLLNIPGIGAIYPLRIILLGYSLVLLYKYFKYSYNIMLIGRDDILLFLFWIDLMILTIANEKWDTTVLYFISFTTIILLISLIINYIKTENERSFALKVLIFNAFVISILAIYESSSNVWIFADSLPTKYNYNSLGILTPVLFFGNTNNLCMFICMCLPCVFLVFKRLYLRVISILITIYTSILCDCRTGIVAVIIFMVLIISIRIFKDKRIKYLIYFVALLIGGFLIIYKNIQLNTRIYIWINAVYNSAKSFFIGSGAGSAIHVNAENGIFNIIKSGAYGGYSIGAVHNYFLELLLETGVLGILILFIWLKKNVILIYKRRGDKDGLYYFIMVIFFAIASVCQSTLTQWFPIWIIVGLMVSYANEKSKLIK